MSGPANDPSFTLNADGSFTYTPTAGFFGTDTFTYLANDDTNDSTVATATITVAPVQAELEAVTTSDGGLSINADGGNDAYFMADSGLANALTQVTPEIQFAANNTPSETVFLSYNTAAGDELAIQTLSANNGLELNFGAGSYVESTAIDYYTLLDGARHPLSITWDSTAGDWEVSVDGGSVGSGTGLNVGGTI